MLSLTLSLVLLSSVSALYVGDAPPPNYQQETDGVWYKYYGSDNKLTYAAAAAICRNDGGLLATPLDADSNRILATLMHSGWIGIDDQDEEGVWRSLEGHLAEYLPWAKNQPDNYADREDCVVQWQEQGWNDFPCTGRRVFTCQWKEPVVITGAISEVKFEGGSAKATSCHPAPWTAEKAFILGHINAWQAGRQPGAQKTEWAIFPTIIWYEFPADKTFIPASVSFRPRQDCCLNEAPTVWQFVGSNDAACGKYGRWTVLCEDLSNEGYPTKHWTKYCDVGPEVSSHFRCLGIRVLNTKHAAGVTSLKDIRMWKKTFQ